MSNKLKILYSIYFIFQKMKHLGNYGKSELDEYYTQSIAKFVVISKINVA